MLGHHICRVQHDESLDPIEWARGLAGQIFLAFSRVGKMKEALEISGSKDVDAFTDWIEKEHSVRKILNEYVIQLLESIGGHEDLNGMDTIGIDSLDEALTISVLHGENKDTIVSYLLEYRKKWPSWIQFLATSRPDPETEMILKPMTGAHIDVQHSDNGEYHRPLTNSINQNMNDVREYVNKKLASHRDWTFGGNVRVPSDVANVVSSNMDNESKISLRVTSRSFRLSFEETINQICDKANGVFMYAREVLCQLDDGLKLDLKKLPKKLEELYIQRYKKTFKDQVCNICQVGLIGKSVQGLKIRRKIK
jgi:hypothetical protein